jgi:hypothetical protein
LKQRSFVCKLRNKLEKTGQSERDLQILEHER